MQQLIPNLPNVSSFSCELCQLGKYIRSSFPNNVSERVSSPFALVHYNIFQYCITFIDDYSRCSWVYLRKTVLSYFYISNILQ